MQSVNLKTIIEFIQRNWPAVTATAVVLATLLLLKGRKNPKPAAIASFPDPDELPPKRKARFYMDKKDEQDIAFSKKGVASKEFCPPNTVFALLRLPFPPPHLPTLPSPLPLLLTPPPPETLLLDPKRSFQRWQSNGLCVKLLIFLLFL